jgi:Na+:H+ antiporter, NhaA family
MASADTDNSAVRASIVLLAATALALAVANSPLADTYKSVLNTGLGTDIGPFDLSYSVKEWIKNGLMAIFFLYVGLEIKSEFKAGALSDPRRASLPFAGAAGGMIAPALVYLAVTGAAPDLVRGWAIPAATDIAFAVGVVGLLGRRVSAPLRAFLLALAVIDDLGAILIIALFYSGALQLAALLGMGLCIAAMWLLNARGDGALWRYLVLGLLLWLFTLQSGINATLAGVITALFIPMRAGLQIPLKSLLDRLATPVNFGIMPIFAFANAGVPILALSMTDIVSPLALGIALGLVIGKPVGILLAVALAAKSGLARLPDGATWLQIAGVGCIAGIGFTMSLFIGALAFNDEAAMNQIRVGVMGGSVIAGIIGAGLMSLAARRRPVVAS